VAPIPTITVKRSWVSLEKWTNIINTEFDKIFPPVEATTDATLAVPLTEDAYEKDGRPFTCYFKSLRGPRPANEDEFTVVEHANEWLALPADRRISYFGMYDGHSGRYSAIYTRIHLHHLIASEPDFTSNIETAIRNGFLKADRNVNEFQGAHNFNCGTTAISLWLVDDELIVGNVGDSQGVLSRAGTAIELTNPHSPQREDEKDRLRAAGGAVVWFGTWRVNGVLAVSRSIGDNNLKHCVIADPEITRFKIGPDDEFLLIATDGLWDVVKVDESITLVKEIERTKGRAAVPDELCEEALRRGSKDNVSIIVVFFCTNQS
jgi:protein phosphatase 1L